MSALRAKFFARVLACRTARPETARLPLVFDGAGAYYKHMMEAIVSEAFSVIEEQGKQVRCCLGKLRDVRRQGEPMDDVEQVTCNITGSEKTRPQMSEGTIVLLRRPPQNGHPPDPVMAMLISRPSDGGTVTFCASVQDSPATGWTIHMTDAQVVVPLRSYVVCARHPDASLVSELLPLKEGGPEDGGEVEAMCGLTRWKSIVKYPVSVRESPSEDADQCGQVRPMAEFDVVEVFPERGFFQLDEEGAYLPPASEAAVRYWLQLPEEHGWLYAAKKVNDRKTVLAKPSGPSMGRSFRHRPAEDDLAKVPPAVLQAHLSTLNRSQRKAVTDFMKSPRRLTLLQGPPGSGKSQTILVVLQTLIDGGLLQEGEVVLVSGPTNKSVHHLATEALSKVSSAPRDSALGRARLAFTGMPDQMGELHLDSGAAPLSLHDIYANGGTKAAAERLTCALTKLAEGNAAAAVEALAFVVDDLVRRAPRTCESAELHSLVSRAKELHRKNNLNAVAATLEEAKTKVAAFPLEQVEDEMLRNCHILFGTLATVGRYALRRKVGRIVRWAVVDEAAQPTEAETLLLLPWDPQKTLLVGDPQQLSATVVSKLGLRCGFDRSLMGRLLEAGQPHQMLKEQYRMLPAIASFPSAHFYHGRLRDAPEVARLSVDVQDELAFWDGTVKTLPPYLVVDVADGKESHGENHSSMSNAEEARLAVNLAETLVASADCFTSGNGMMCVLTFYKGQVRLLEWELERRASSCAALTSLRAEGRLQVHSVDSFQGSEAEVVIVSFVRTRDFGFLKDDRRLNVALTRAQRRLVVLANVRGLQWARTSETSKPALTWMLEDAGERCLVVHARLLETHLTSQRPADFWQKILRDILQEAGGSLDMKALAEHAADRNPLLHEEIGGQTRKAKAKHFQKIVLGCLPADWVSEDDTFVRLAKPVVVSSRCHS